MDLLSEQLIDTYAQYYNFFMRENVVLGFDIDSRLHDFSRMQRCSFEARGLRGTEVPGILLKEYPSSKPERSPKHHDCRDLHVYVNGLSVSVSAIYNGFEMLVTGIHSHDPELLTHVRYVEVVLRLYKSVTDTHIGMSCYKREAEGILSSIATVCYTPITSTYSEMLERVTDGYVAGEDCHINPKHDGVAMWMFMSPTVPLSLVSQSKKKQVTHRYVGRLADQLCNIRRRYCIMIEKVEDVYVMTDCFTDEDKCYTERLKDMQEVHMLVSRLTNLRVLLTNTYHICCSCPSTRTPIDEAMSMLQGATDGYIAYLGNSRPMKIKLKEHMTLDLEFNKSNSTYLLPEGIAEEDLRDIQLPTDDITMSTTLDSIVLEVSVHSKLIVRSRPDRIRGNSAHVINTVIGCYRRDSKYSNVDVWRGKDVRFCILVNRAFKRYMYMKYLPRGSSLLDIGSGNGGDIPIWRHMEYKVLAVEVDGERFKVLSSRASDCSNIKTVLCDMRRLDVLRGYLSSSAIRYANVSFMRSLSNMNKDMVKLLLSELVVYGSSRMIIVTMVRDFLVEHRYTYEDQSFCISPSQEKVTVAYTASDKNTTYSDYCYTVDEWMSIFEHVGYKAVVEYQASFVSNTFSLKCTQSTYPCFTDVGFCLSRQ